MIAPSREHYPKFKMQRTNASAANIINYQKKENVISLPIEGIVLSAAIWY
jgi:hypothetical protein